MFTVNIKVKQKNPEAFAQLKKRLQKISEKRAVAGFPKGKLNNPHYENGASIIDVAIWNNFGIGVPRRDFMTPASKEWQEYFEQMLELAKDAIIDGTQDIDEFLGMMGAEGAELVKQSITKLKTPPNSPETIRRKGGKNEPLIDSGDMLNAATYELRRRTK